MLSKCFLYVKCETPQSGNTTLPLTDSQGRAGDPVETGPPVPPAPPPPPRPAEARTLAWVGATERASEPPRAVCTSAGHVGCNYANFSLKMVWPS